MKTDAPRTLLTTASGRTIDLAAPLVTDIDFADIAEHLSKLNRYCGATRGYTYSVAEHSVRCADAALKETKDKRIAAYLLCHDMHEAYIGDDVTPKKRALDQIIGSFGVLAGEVERAFAAMTDKLDFAIHTAAGLPWPPSDRLRDVIHHYDRVLLFTEFRDLMPVAPYFPVDDGVELLKEKIAGVPYADECWPWQTAMDVLLDRCRMLLPAMQERLS